jgi:prephenate dehydratase
MTSRVRVAFQGEHGAFSEAAALILRPEATTVPCRTFDAVVQAVTEGAVDLGLLPVENTLAGGVVAAYDALAAGAVAAIEEVVTPIRHCVMGVEDASLELLREIRSHPVALAQCGDLFVERPTVSPVSVHDTAGAAMAVAELGDPAVAAIAPRGAAARYGLILLAEDVQDRDDNQTRFLLIERAEERAEFERPEEPEVDASRALVRQFKTALSVETDNRPGALRDLLEPFAWEGHDLNFVESRPTGRPWTYRFLIEFRHAGAYDVEEFALGLLRVARRVSILGTFEAHQG